MTQTPKKRDWWFWRLFRASLWLIVLLYHSDLGCNNAVSLHHEVNWLGSTLRPILHGMFCAYVEKSTYVFSVHTVCSEHVFWCFNMQRLKKQLNSLNSLLIGQSSWKKRNRAGSSSYVFHMWEEKAVHISIQTICFPHIHRKHIWKTNRVNKALLL